MSASVSAALPALPRTVHEITMLAVRCKIAVTRDASGVIVGIEPVQADEKRTKVIRAAAAGLANGRTLDDLTLIAGASVDLFRELHAIARGRA